MHRGSNAISLCHTHLLQGCGNATNRCPKFCVGYFAPSIPDRCLGSIVQRMPAQMLCENQGLGRPIQCSISLNCIYPMRNRDPRHLPLKAEPLGRDFRSAYGGSRASYDLVEHRSSAESWPLTPQLCAVSHVTDMYGKVDAVRLMPTCLENGRKTPDPRSLRTIPSCSFVVETAARMVADDPALHGRFLLLALGRAIVRGLFLFRALRNELWAVRYGHPLA